MHTPDPQPIRFASIDHRALHGRVFGIHAADLLRHAWLLGRSGSGKSAVLERLAVGLIERNHGCAVIDPHGDLADALLTRIPRHRINDIVVFDPADRDHPVGLNLLESVDADARPLVASAIVGIMRRVFESAWGPRTEHLVRNVVLALAETPGTTLVSAGRMLVDEQFRVSVVARVTDPLVRQYWTKEFASLPNAFRAEVVAPLLNKLGGILTPMLRNILGQARTAFSFRSIMDERKVFIGKLAKGAITEDGSTVLGAMLTTLVQLAAYSRADVDAERRIPFVLIADEFQSFATRSFTELLSEARKFGCGVVLANQFVSQIDDTLRDAVLANAGTIMTFALGPDDADLFARVLGPELTAHDLTRLAPHQIALRLSVHGRTSDPFTAVTLPPDGVARGYADTIRRVSRERYGRPRSVIERQLFEQLESGSSRRPS